ncbi:exo-alpha-sialidase [Alishewanella tabrizica]|uniref:Uncharacterized protein n=1 Tax=Alishewanella tabrizica TaxID=671278 RepID=A0ABQ2WSB3_9ALTE|nr:exo-alpha-sialidase [Alishewanella tabrizica]GGW69126.1 hypothetical protein GCM10008111_26530 [Alishewanella tabrizica]
MNIKCIWQKGAHNAFTDLIAWQDALWCVFREASAHVSPDGALRVLRSIDQGRHWQSVALVQHPAADLRDPKFSTHPDGRLLLVAAGALHHTELATHQSYLWHSQTGLAWSEAMAIGEPNFWLWRLSWLQDTVYALAYHCAKPTVSRLYQATHTLAFSVSADIYQGSYANENSILFQEDGTALCLLRRDPEPGLLGRSLAPYTQWHWQEIGCRIGGPHWLQLPDGRLLACVRLYNEKIRTSLCWLDANTGTLSECLTLPSGGDCSYAGMVIEGEQLYLSYYSSHEGKTAIYFSQLSLDTLNKTGCMASIT